MSEIVKFGSCQIKTPKPSTSSAKNRKNKSLSVEALKATIEKKKEATARALGIVIRFSEGVVTEECLLENAYYLNQCHFQDVTEERAILKLCGYPVCGNKLKDIPKKQYHISTKQNKVFDITDRKNFCSNLCYKASKYLQDQLLTSPIWLRDNEKHVSFKLLPLESKKTCRTFAADRWCVIENGNRGILGVEVDIGLNRVTQDQIEKTEECNLEEEFTGSVSRLANEATSFDEDHKEIVNSLKQRQNGLSEDFEDCSSVNDNQCTVDESVNDNAEMEQDSNNDRDECNTGKDSTRICEEHDINIVNTNLQDTNEHFKYESNKAADNKSCAVSNNVNLLDSVIEKQCESNNIQLNDKKEITQTEVNKREQAAHSYSENINDNSSQVKEGESKIKNKTKTQRVKGEKKSKNISNDEIEPVLNIVMKIEHNICEWITIDSLCFLYGEDKVKALLSDKGRCIKELHNACGNAMVDPYLYERYLAICRKLNVLEVEDSKLDTEIVNENSKLPQKPLPDYSSLLKESKNIELKVKQFYKGDKVTFEEAAEKVTENNKENNRTTVLPLVDLHAQRSLRRRIVLDKLNRVLSDVIRLLGLKGFDISEGVRTLVSTFSLSAHNITFRPLEWNLIALAIIKLLSIKDDIVAKALNSASVVKHLTLMLMSYQVDGGYLDRLTDWLTDIDHIIKRNSEVV